MIKYRRWYLVGTIINFTLAILNFIYNALYEIDGNSALSCSPYLFLCLAVLSAGLFVYFNLNEQQ